MSISPNVPSPQDSYHYENTGTPRWIAVLFGVLFVALAAMGFFGYTSQSRLSQQLSKAEDQNKTLSLQLAAGEFEHGGFEGSRRSDEAESRHDAIGTWRRPGAARKSIRKDQIAADQKLNHTAGRSAERTAKKKSAQWRRIWAAQRRISKPRGTTWKRPRASWTARKATWA